MTPKKETAKTPRTAPAAPDQKTLATGERPELESAGSTGNNTRKPWKKKSVAENILSQLNKLREEVAEKEREYNQAKKQLDQLEALRKVLEETQ